MFATRSLAALAIPLRARPRRPTPSASSTDSFVLSRREPLSTRVVPDVAHPNGITEIEVGTYSVTGDRIDIELSTTDIGLAPTAKEVTALGRSFRIGGDELSYSVRMGAVGQPLQDHLAAVLQRRA